MQLFALSLRGPSCGCRQRVGCAMSRSPRHSARAAPASRPARGPNRDAGVPRACCRDKARGTSQVCKQAPSRHRSCPRAQALASPTHRRCSAETADQRAKRARQASELRSACAHRPARPGEQPATAIAGEPLCPGAGSGARAPPLPRSASRRIGPDPVAARGARGHHGAGGAARQVGARAGRGPAAGGAPDSAAPFMEMA